jgi:CubicO group peptidase (beta-lactamase class C family)
VLDKFQALYNGEYDRQSQLCVYVGDEKVIDIYGKNNTDVIPFDGNSIMNLFSCGKTVASLMIARQVHDGNLKFDDTIASKWPEFAKHGKENIKMCDVLRH